MISQSQDQPINRTVSSVAEQQDPFLARLKDISSLPVRLNAGNMGREHRARRRLDEMQLDHMSSILSGESKPLPSGTSLHTVYTIGYRLPGAMDKIVELIDAGAMLIDIRLHPASRFHPQWSRKQLQERFGWKNYEHLDALGNVNYRNPNRPWQLRDAEEGLLWLQTYLKERDVVLMCGCPDPDHCHRSLVCSSLLQQLREVHIVHLVARPVVTVEWKEVPLNVEVTP